MMIDKDDVKGAPVIGSPSETKGMSGREAGLALLKKKYFTRVFVLNDPEAEKLFNKLFGPLGADTRSLLPYDKYPTKEDGSILPIKLDHNHMETDKDSICLIRTSPCRINPTDKSLKVESFFYEAPETASEPHYEYVQKMFIYPGLIIEEWVNNTVHINIVHNDELYEIYVGRCWR